MKYFVQLIIISTFFLYGQTPEQIKNAKKEIKRSGMSLIEVRAAAKAQGYTDKQIDAVIQKEKGTNTSKNEFHSESINEIALPDIGKSNEVAQEERSFENNTSTEPSILEDYEYVIDEKEPQKIESKIEVKESALRYFGYDIFSRDPALFQATSVGVVDPDYLIGPGDEIIIMLWGETQFRQLLQVDREGFVFIPEIGQVFVNGLNLNLLESKLFKVFSQSYATLNPQGGVSTTFLDVSIGNLRPLRIQVLGEVSQPGAYTVSPSATLFSSLYYFNGPTTNGSLRDIQLIRGGKKIASIDFYDYLLTGKKPEDQKLQLDDIIFIPRRMKTVKIEGEINRQGIYEMKPKEGLAHLIAIAGDLKISAYTGRSQIDRIVPFEKRADLGMDRMYTDVNLEQALNSEVDFPLQDGDLVKIFSIMDFRMNVVELRGAVVRPGNYDLGAALKISELINKAQGLLGDAYLKRLDVIRINEDFTEQIIKLDLSKIMEKDFENDIELQGLDRVRVYGMSEMVSNNFVEITGHVKTPGRFRLQENMTLYDLIFKSGGFLDKEFKKRTYLERADLIRFNSDRITRTISSFNLEELLASPDSKVNLFLKPGDYVRIYQKDIFVSNKPVSINGVVRNPGSYGFKIDMSLKDLILESGGLNSGAYVHRVDVARIDPSNNQLTQYADIIIFDIDENFNIVKSKSFDNNANELIGDSNNFLLKPYDLVSIRPNPYFQNQKQVSISGEVLYPGNYTILKPDEKITDIIKRSGGLRPNAYPAASQYIRNGIRMSIALEEILDNTKSNLNFDVQDGDEIMILPHPNIVQIAGEVNTPGIHKHVPKKRLRYYIKMAGGLGPDSDEDNIWVEYPNRDSKKYNKWSMQSPKVIDGSIITVGKKKEEEPFDKTEYLKEVTVIIANLAQALTLVALAR